MVFSATGKTFAESGVDYFHSPDAAIFMLYAIYGRTSFPRHPSIKPYYLLLDTYPLNEEKLITGDMIQITSETTNLALHSVIYIKNRVVLSIEPVSGIIHFQDLDQLRDTWSNTGTIHFEVVHSLHSLQQST